MIEPPTDESGEYSGNRIHQRRSIINELDLIKARVDQVMPLCACAIITVLQVVHAWHICTDNTKL